MFEIVRAGGWLMLPLVLCSVMAVAITLERLWSLQRKRVLPGEVPGKVRSWIDREQLDDRHVKALEASSPLGRILAAGVARRSAPREVIKEAIEDTGRHVVHDLERFLNTLGTIAAITPLLGLLGTVIGMVKVFAAITAEGVGNPSVLAGGISEALITTAAGLSIAIPTLICYRYLRRRIDTIVLEMEKEAMDLVDALINHRRGQPTPSSDAGGAPIDGGASTEGTDAGAGPANAGRRGDEEGRRGGRKRGAKAGREAPGNETTQSVRRQAGS
jgi:biopolymer transport protein ExbB